MSDVQVYLLTYHEVRVGRQSRLGFAVAVYESYSGGHTLVRNLNVPLSTACWAALYALERVYGKDKPVVEEFRQRYRCDKTDDVEERQNPKGFKMDDDLDGISPKRFPLWIKR